MGLLWVVFLKGSESGFCKANCCRTNMLEPWEDVSNHGKQACYYRLPSALLSATWAGELGTVPAVRNIMRTSWNWEAPRWASEQTDVQQCISEEFINACGMFCLMLAAAVQEGQLGVVAGSSMGPSVWNVVARGCQPERLRVRSAFWLSDSPAGCTHWVLAAVLVHSSGPWVAVKDRCDAAGCWSSQEVRWDLPWLQLEHECCAGQTVGLQLEFHVLKSHRKLM